MVQLDGTGININMPPASSAFEQEVVYMECRHNHAASLGRVAYDGCHEFLRDNNDAMICAACECHRSFHRKHTIYNPISPPPPQSKQQTDQNAVVMNNNATTTHPVLLPVPVVAGSSMMMPRRKKRTLFTSEQRNRMISFAERLGWRPQRGDKKEIQDFCMEMGMSRRMFLVWLSNNRRRAIHHQNKNKNNNNNNNK